MHKKKNKKKKHKRKNTKEKEEKKAKMFFLSKAQMASKEIGPWS
jgi:hypothetical protein